MGCIQTSGPPPPLSGIRLHFHSLVKGLTGLAASKAQLGLGHSYSRAKVKFNVNRADNMIIQSIALLDQLDKDINTFSMRVRWVSGVSLPRFLLMLTTDSTSQYWLYRNRRDSNLPGACAPPLV